MRCHSVRDSHSSVCLFFQLSFVARLSTVKFVLLSWAALTSASFPRKPIRLTAFLYICDSPFLALLLGTRKRVGSAPQASETVFREGPDDIVYAVSKGARAGNVGGKPKPGGLYPRCCADQKEEKEWKQM